MYTLEGYENIIRDFTLPFLSRPFHQDACSLNKDSQILIIHWIYEWLINTHRKLELDRKSESI